MKKIQLEYLKGLKEQTENTIKEKSQETNIFVNVAVVLVVVILVAFSLRVAHDMIYYNKSMSDILGIKAAAAATNAAELIHQSHTTVNIRPNTGFTFTLKFNNTGDSTWTKDKVYLKSSTTALKFKHNFWPDPYLPAQLQEEIVAPGEAGTFVFALESPPSLNLNYSGDFILVNDNVLISGGGSNVIMNVVADPENMVTETTPEENNTDSGPTSNDQQMAMCSLNFRIAGLIDGTESGVDNTTCVQEFNLPAEGPIMRVGLFYSDEIITIRNTKAWQVLNENGTLLASIPAEIEIPFFYNNETKEYSFDFIDQTIRTTSYLSLKNINNGVYTTTSYHNSPSYNSNIDYNDFIGDFEIRHNDSKDRTWVIEILPVETYLKGIQETTNYDPIEYLKTMAVAARTYALYHYDRYTKHADEFFHVDSKFDQVYKGFVSMQIFPRVGEAVSATSGIIGTYNDKIIVAPYFSRSDGRTRSYSEVWTYEVPYLISVPTPYTEGKTLFGHGVGIDATDALNRAEFDGWSYDQLLKYYYTGINLEKIY